ncbi:MAG: hypothetical protein WC942_04230 [Clostridia bacterium]|jgi:hypothetical protein
MVTITEEEYNRLVNSAKFLNCLEACGVDNWEWYSEALKMFKEEYND